VADAIAPVIDADADDLPGQRAFNLLQSWKVMDLDAAPGRCLELLPAKGAYRAGEAQDDRKA
jgi:hypothetical protein